MLTKADISKFYEDVEALGLRSPVSTISKATGVNMGVVSVYLAKKKVPSENFIRKFYESFADKFTNVARETPTVDHALMRAQISVLMHSMAELLAATSGESSAVVLRRLEKAAEEIVKMGG